MPERFFSDLTVSDIEPILTIERESFSQPWSRAAFLAGLEDPNAFSYVVRTNIKDIKKIIAYICFRVFADEMHILKIAVLPKWRCQKTGTWLLRRCLDLAIEIGSEKAYLEVRPSNISARSFYDKFGFQIIGRSPKYYSDTGENALVLMKELKEVT